MSVSEKRLTTKCIIKIIHSAYNVRQAARLCNSHKFGALGGEISVGISFHFIQLDVNVFHIVFFNAKQIA